MKSNFLTIGLAFSFAILASCGGGGGDYSDEESSDAEEASTEEMADAPTYSGETIRSVRHEVEDYAIWVAVYNEVSIPESRISHYINVDNPNEVIVFELTESHESAVANMNSDELKSAMEKAGVTSEPIIQTSDMIAMNTDDTSDKYRVVIRHEVADFDAWKEKFDADEDRRSEAGLTFRGMGTDSNNANFVTIVFSTSDLEGARAMLADPGLKKAMEEGGVISEPEVSYFMVPDMN